MTIYKLEELFEINTGSTPNTSNKAFWKPELLWYTPIDLKNKIHTTRKISNGITRTIPKGTVVLSTRASIGYVGITNNIAWHSVGTKSFINIRKDLINDIFFYYWCLKNTKEFINRASGTIFLEISSTEIKKIQINLPSLNNQNQIINYLKNHEILFFKYFNYIQINSVVNCQKDLELIEKNIHPMDILREKILSLKKKITQILIKFYQINDSEQTYFRKIIHLNNVKYQSQTHYLSTKSINCLTKNNQNKINLTKLSKIPSRANLTPQANSFIFSKLVGENKIYYFDQQPKEVFSTGFFNFQTPYCDHVLGFLLSKDFIQQKRMLANGTTMVGLTYQSLKKIKIKKPKIDNNKLTILLNKLDEQNQIINKLREKILKILTNKKYSN